MGLVVTHKFTSNKADGSDASLIQPSNWNATHQITGLPTKYSDDYNFTPQAPGGSLTAGVGASITIAPVPSGVNASDTEHYVYLSNGAGIAEAVKIAGGTAVAGAATGTLIVTPANNHSGAWTIGSATAGISEAIWDLATSGGKVELPVGILNIHAPITRRDGVPIWISGQGPEVTVLAVATDFPTSVKGVFIYTGATSVTPWHDAGGVSKMTVQFVQPDSTNTATYTHWPPFFYTSNANRICVSDINIYTAWDGIKIDAASGTSNFGTFRNINISWFHRAFDLDQCFDTVRVENFHGSVYGLTTNQYTAFVSATSTMVAFYIGRCDDLQLFNCASYPAFADFHVGSDGNASTATLEACWMDQGGYTQSQGQITILGGSIGGSLTGQDSLNYKGGQLFVHGARIVNGVSRAAIVCAPTAGFINSPTAYPAKFELHNCLISTLNQDAIQPVLISTDAGFVGTFDFKLMGCVIDRYPDIAYTQQSVVVSQAGGTIQATIIGNTWRNAATGSGTGLSLVNDNNHLVSGNQGGGYGYSLAGTIKTQFIGNLNFAVNLHKFIDPVNLSAGTTAALAGSATLNKQCGVITSEALTTAAAAEYTLTLTNSLVTTGSLVFLNAYFGTSTQGEVAIIRVKPTANTLTFVIKNIHSTQAFNGTIIVQYLVINPS